MFCLSFLTKEAEPARSLVVCFDVVVPIIVTGGDLVDDVLWGNQEFSSKENRAYFDCAIGLWATAAIASIGDKVIVADGVKRGRAGPRPESALEPTRTHSSHINTKGLTYCGEDHNSISRQ